MILRVVESLLALSLAIVMVGIVSVGEVASRISSSVLASGAPFIGDGHDGSRNVVSPTTTTTQLLPSCGNGIIDGVDECDDGNLAPGDGCDERCRVEQCWSCDANEPTACMSVGETSCNDGDVCTEHDVCVDGNCQGAQRDATADKVYWSDYPNVGSLCPQPIIRSGVDGCNAGPIIRDILWPWSLAVESNSGKLYWGAWGTVAASGCSGSPATTTTTTFTSTGAAVRRSDLDGSNVEDVVILRDIGLLDDDAIFSLVLDSVHSRVYWSVWGGDVWRAAFDGSFPEKIASTGYAVADLAIDATGGKIYWAATQVLSPNEIGRANLDGTQMETLTYEESSTGAFTGIAVDGIGGHIFWAREHSADPPFPNGIWRAALDGSAKTLMVATEGYASSPEFDASETKLYWTEQRAGRYVLARANTDGSGYETVFELVQPARPRTVAPADGASTESVYGLFSARLPSRAANGGEDSSWPPGFVTARSCGNGRLDPDEFCDDGNRTDGDGCDSNCTPTACGNGIVTAGEECDDGNLNAGDKCSPNCRREPVCTSTPEPSCRTVSGGRTRLKIRSSSDSRKNLLKWKWLRGDKTTFASFGDPFSVLTDYQLCLYDNSAVSQPLFEAFLATGDCRGVPCWKQQGSRRFVYRNKPGDPDGIVAAKLRAGESGSPSLHMTGRGSNLSVPALPLDLAVIAQFIMDNGSSRECWQATYLSSRRNGPERFSAKAP